MGEDGEGPAFGECGNALEQRQRAALRSGRGQAPDYPAAAIADAIQLTFDKIELRPGVIGGLADQRPQLSWYDLAGVEDGVELGPVSHSDRVSDADPGLVIGAQNRIKDLIAQWRE